MSALPMRELEAMAKCRDIRADHKLMTLFPFVAKNSKFLPALTLPVLPFALSCRFFLIYSCFAERLYLPA
jgi:hypothetical protein